MAIPSYIASNSATIIGGGAGDAGKPGLQQATAGNSATTAIQLMIFILYEGIAGISHSARAIPLQIN